MPTILTDDPDAYQYLVKHAAHLEQLAGAPVLLPTIELVDDLTDPSPEVAEPDAAPGPDTGTPGTEAPDPAGAYFVPAYVKGATVTHAVEVRPNRVRRRAERYTVCDRSRTRVVDQAQYHASLEAVTCGQCRKRLVALGVLSAAAG